VHNFFEGIILSRGRILHETDYTETVRSTQLFLHVFLPCLLMAGCGAPDSPKQQDNVQPGETRLELGKNDNRQLLEFYLGGLTSSESGDPYSEGFLRESSGSHYVSVDELERVLPESAADLQGIAADGVIDWDEFEGFVLKYYYTARKLPPTVDGLRDMVGDWSDDSKWMVVPVQGVMSPYHRDVHVETSSVMSALLDYKVQGDQLIYPIGTTFVSEHIDGDQIVEVSAMRKRGDGYWDFFAYGADGGLTSQLKKEPRNLDVPTKCVGCHFGTRLFEPEKSFPATPRPGPDGPRGITVEDALPDASMVGRLDEHRKRSDQILGLYATLLLNRLTIRREANELSEDQLAILALFNDGL
jgi:hypothetical protein